MAASASLRPTTHALRLVDPVHGQWVDVVDDTERGWVVSCHLVEERKRNWTACTTSVAPDAAYTHAYRPFKATYSSDLISNSSFRVNKTFSVSTTSLGCQLHTLWAVYRHACSIVESKSADFDEQGI